MGESNELTRCESTRRAVLVSVDSPFRERGVPGDSWSQQWKTRGSTPRGPLSCHVLLPPRPCRPAAGPLVRGWRGRDGDAPRWGRGRAEALADVAASSSVALCPRSTPRVRVPRARQCCTLGPRRRAE